MSAPMLSPSSPTSPTSANAAKSDNRVNNNNKASSTPGLTRPKRAQVSRACDWCRVHRVKCDTEQPCNNCKSRGAQCTVTGANEIRNLPHAFREIERLRSRVQELEQELNKRDSAPAAVVAASSPPTLQQAASAAPQVLNDNELWREGVRPARDFGLYTGDGRVKQWFGPSSLFFFIGRMTSYLAKYLANPPADHTIHWSSTKSFTVTAPDPLRDITVELSADQDSQATSGLYLNASQEEYFLGFFWQSYHCSLQIIDEINFRGLYRSLWSDSANMKTRKSSALVDIILALCIQYDTALPMRHSVGNRSDPDTKDTAIAGRYYYQRCQSLLLAELECPTISTLQCHIFSVYYLCCAGFQNMAHSTLALAVRTAHILGLHLEPPEHLPRPERELRKRLWWTLYSLESKTCMKLGRPWSAPMSDTTCGLPADDHALAIQSGSAVLAGGNVTWLTYTVQSTKLVLHVRNIYVAYYQELARVISTLPPDSSPCPYESPHALESLALFLQSRLGELDAWVTAIPPALLCKRKEGVPFSTDTSPLAIETFAPLWLQRQRVYTELLYHNLCIILYRPLINFSSSSQPPLSPTPTTLACAQSCVNHAITLTRITHQALSQTEILKGFHEGFQWQWNAAITMIGFYLAHPLTPNAATARAAINMAIEVFEIFGRHFAVGTRAARVVRELTARTDSLLGLGGTPESFVDVGNGLTSEAGSVGDSTPVSVSVPAWEAMVVDGGLATTLDGTGAKLQDVLSGTMDVAFSVDSFNSFEAFHGGNGFSFADSWVFASE